MEEKYILLCPSALASAVSVVFTLALHSVPDEVVTWGPLFLLVAIPVSKIHQNTEMNELRKLQELVFWHFKELNFWPNLRLAVLIAVVFIKKKRVIWSFFG